jgi:hypothetical protein
MLLRILIKLLTVILGIIALNTICSVIFLIGSDIETETFQPGLMLWVHSIYSYLSEHLFTKLYDFLPFSWIISSIGFLSFVVYDYFKHKKVGYEQNIITDFFIDIIAIFFSLLVVVASLFISFYILPIIYFLLIVLQIPFRAFLSIKQEYTEFGNAIPDDDYHYYILNYSGFSALPSFIIRFVAIYITGCIFEYIIKYKAPKVVKWNDYEKYRITQLLKYLSDKFNVFFKFALLIFGLYLLPITFLWVYPVVLIWLRLVPIPDFAFPFYVYSFILIIILLTCYLFFLELIKSKRERNQKRDFE